LQDKLVAGKQQPNLTPRHPPCGVQHNRVRVRDCSRAGRVGGLRCRGAGFVGVDQTTGQRRAVVVEELPADATKR